MIKANTAQRAVEPESKTMQEEPKYDPETGYRREGDRIIFPGKSIPRVSPGFKESLPAPTGSRGLHRLVKAKEENEARKADLGRQLQVLGDRVLGAVQAGSALSRSGEYGRIMGDLSETSFIISLIDAAIPRMEGESEEKKGIANGQKKA